MVEKLSIVWLMFSRVCENSLRDDMGTRPLPELTGEQAFFNISY